MYRQSEKKLVKQQYLPYMSPQNGELRPSSGYDRFVSLRHPCKFQRVSRLGSVTARHSSSARQPNFAALNRGRHLYSAGRPSRWSLAHISSLLISWHTSVSYSISINYKQEGQHPLTGQRAPPFQAGLRRDIGLWLMATWKARFRLHVCCN